MEKQVSRELSGLPSPPFHPLFAPLDFMGAPQRRRAVSEVDGSGIAVL